MPWTLRHAVLLLAVLLGVEVAANAGWKRLQLPPLLASLNRACPGLVARAVGSLDAKGSAALEEMASLAWDALTRAADLLVIWGFARGLRHSGPRMTAEGRSGTAVRTALIAGFGFAAAVAVGEGVARWRGASLLAALRGTPDPADGTPGVILLFFVVGVMLAPAVEEILFRGILLDACGTAPAAILVTALVFAGFHPLAAWMNGQAMQMPWAQLLAGLVFAWLTRRTGGILAAWILHAAANAFVLGLQAAST